MLVRCFGVGRGGGLVEWGWNMGSGRWGVGRITRGWVWWSDPACPGFGVGIGRRTGAGWLPFGLVPGYTLARRVRAIWRYFAYRWGVR